jgi:hypothetical protein
MIDNIKNAHLNLYKLTILLVSHTLNLFFEINHSMDREYTCNFHYNRNHIKDLKWLSSVLDTILN